MSPDPPHLRPVPDAEPPGPHGAGVPHAPWDGVTAPRSRRGGRFLTDVLVELELVGETSMKQAVDQARAAGKAPEAVLLETGALSQPALSRAIAERHGLDHLDLAAFQVDMGAANLIPSSAAKRYGAVPVKYRPDGSLLIAMADPANVLALDDLALMTGHDVKPAVVSEEDIAGLISRLSRLDDAVATAAIAESGEDQVEVVDLRESADDAPVIKLVNQLIARAVDEGASDIHLAPDDVSLRVRYRVDGVLLESATVPRRMASGVISRVKIMAELDIGERRLPQDGRVGLTIEDRHVDLRVVTLPSVFGEGAVIRILDKGAVSHQLDRLGFLGPELTRFRRAFGQAYGAVLVTGPTGSGKSTSLYAALAEVSTPEKNVITIEDPVEFQIPGITQVQVNNRAGLTFATGLRSLMRADPDVIMVGEIRDREAAQIAVEAALTGHLVLSTLHTNDAPTAISRLIEMGIEPFLVASAIDCVVAQRLARLLCVSCKVPTTIPAEALRENGFPAVGDVAALGPVGCARCGGTGYKGRIGLYEVMSVTDDIREVAIARGSADAIGKLAVAGGMRRLREDGLEKVKLGLTSLNEVARVTGSGTAVD